MAGGHGRGGGPPPRATDVRDARLDDSVLPQLDFTAPRWNGKYENRAGAQLFIRRLPASAPGAQPAMFVHGLGGSSTNWTDLGVLLRSRLDCVALDLPGYGRSGPAVLADYSLDAQARVVVAQIEADGRGAVHLFGNSMGGAIAVRVAVSRPDLVRTLTLISPAVPDLRLRRPGTDPGMALLLLPGLSAYAKRRMAAISPAQRVHGMIEVCFAHPELVPDWRVREAVEDMAGRAGDRGADDAFVKSLRAIAGSYVAGGRRSAWQLLSRITAPTLVVWGDQDRLVAATLARRVAATIPDSRLLVLTEVGHCAQMEDPNATGRAFLAMLTDASRRHRASPGTSVTYAPDVS